MASTYTANTGIEKIGSGEQAGSWGTTTNTNFDIIDDALNGVITITISGNTTLTSNDGTASNGHHKVLLLGGTPSGAFNLTIDPNDQQKWYFINNNTGQTATVKQGGGSGTTVAIGSGTSAIVYADGSGSNANVGNISTDVLGDTSPQLGGNLDTNGKNINFGDAGTPGTDDTLQFGASQDLKIYHHATNGSFIVDSGTGNLNISASQVSLLGGADGAETMATFADDGAVTLYHNNAAKIATSSTGVTVTGNITIGSAVVTEAQLEILDGATVTTTELNLMDGGTSRGTTAVAAGDGIVTNDGGTMRQTNVQTFSTYFNQNLVEAKTALNVSGTVTVTPSGATSVYQPLVVASGSQTVRVAITNLVAGQYVVIDKTTSANSMTIDWTNNGAVTSSGISLGSSAELAIGIFNGAGFSFTETVKF